MTDRFPLLGTAAAAWMAGVGAAALGLASWLLVLVLLLVAMAAGLALARREPRLVLVAALLLVPLAGALRYEAVRPPEHPGGVARYNDGGTVRLLGTIVSDPEERPRSLRFIVHVEAVEVEGAWQETGGRVMVTARQYPRYRYGDHLLLAARLTTPESFDGFDYREYLAQRGIVSQSLFPSIEAIGTGGGSAWQRAIISLRTPMSDALKRALPEPESALARGILLGQRASIPAHVNEEFNDAGISHLIAISGYNVMLVAGFVIGALGWLLGRRHATVVAMIVIVAYAAFVGGEASVLRAAAMALVMLGATLAGRPGSAIISVVLAAAVLTMWRPLIIVDVSFQLSAMATLGIVLKATDLTEQIFQKLVRWLPPGPSSFLAEQVSVTTVASIAVLPVIAWHFERLSLVSLPANLLAGPVFAFALLGSFAAAVAGLLDEAAGALLGEVAYLPLAWLVLVARVASSVPYAAIEVADLSAAEALFVFGALFFAVMVWLRPAKYIEEIPVPRAQPGMLYALPVLVLAAFVWWGALQSPPDRLRVTVLDVGQGDAILLESPSGHRVLVDGGPSAALITQALGAALPAGERRIDLMVLSHGHDDHVTGLVEVLYRYEVGAVLTGPMHGTSTAYQAWWREIGEQQIPVYVAETGQWLDLGRGVRIEVLAPLPGGVPGSGDVLNDNSVVLRAVYGEVAFLLTGDIEASAEAMLLASGVEVAATVLKVAHHGADTSTTPAFLDAVSPSLAVVSAGAANAYAHPTPSFRLRTAFIPLLRTDLHGHVRLETDGRDLWLDVQHRDSLPLRPAVFRGNPR